jgi:thioredoxin-related protein
MRTWKTFVLVIALALSSPVLATAEQHEPTLPEIKQTEDGMYAPAWLYESAMDLRKDLAAAAKQGKRLVIFWEQKDCFDCKPMYDVNLRIPRIVGKITENFNVIKLDILGGRMITDLDGTAMSEEKLAMKSRVSFAPTLQFLPESLEKAAGKGLADAEIFRSEGYFKPFHFSFLFHYVKTKGYESQPEFQRWLGEIGRGLEAKGIEYDIWADSLPHHLPAEY